MATIPVVLPAQNTNPTAVAFCNQRIRPMADYMAKTYFTCKQILALWNSQGMGTLIPNNAGLVVDGSGTDGRNPITNASANAIIAHAQAYVTEYEAASNLILNDILKVAVNTIP